MVDVSKTLGALLVGGLVAAVFLDACHTTFVAISLWDDLVNHFGDSARADYIPWSLALTIAVTVRLSSFAVLTFLVHCFLVHRIYKLSMANLYITIPLDRFLKCHPINRTSLLAYVSDRITQFEDIHFSIHLVVYVGACALIPARYSDNWIAVLPADEWTEEELAVVIIHLYIKHILDSIMLYAFELGALTCAAAIAAMICWLAMPSNLIFMGFHFVIAKFYANSLLATLNTRKPLKQPTRSQSYSGERYYYGPDSRHRSKRISANTELNNIASVWTYHFLHYAPSYARLNSAPDQSR
ncbi:hypothetical protein L208DRAFT_1382752 [Tricholoma matsutake]|nr:hypothetical protein L208DRAFT_1382752 [Tricholoma matsutake 945]